MSRVLKAEAFDVVGKDLFAHAGSTDPKEKAAAAGAFSQIALRTLNRALEQLFIEFAANAPDGRSEAITMTITLEAEVEE